MAERSKEEIYEILDQKVGEYLAVGANCAQTTFLCLQEQPPIEIGG